ncbi:MAG: ABC transporter substrate-binding protein [Desulfamplus sp.]|nr:ABC transporter substrate-binding protein [Desulfamplus sp.]
MTVFYEGQISHAESVVLGSGTWALLTGEDLPEQGTITKLIRDAYAMVNITVERKELPWKRVLVEIANLDLDGGYPFGKTTKREAKFIFSDPIGTATRYIYYRKGTVFDWKTVDDLEGLRIGIVRGSVFGAVHEELQQRIAADPTFATIEEVAEDIQNIQKLEMGRIDICFVEQNQSNLLLSQLAKNESQFNPDVILHAPKPLMSESPLYLMFRNDKRGIYLRDLFNQGLHKLKMSHKIR